MVSALGAGTGTGKGDADIELDEEWRNGLEMVKGIVRGAKEGVGDEVEDGWSDDEREVVRQMKALEPQVRSHLADKRAFANLRVVIVDGRSVRVCISSVAVCG